VELTAVGFYPFAWVPTSEPFGLAIIWLEAAFDFLK
jgi:hypothetical protein